MQGKRSFKHRLHKGLHSVGVEHRRAKKWSSDLLMPLNDEEVVYAIWGQSMMSPQSRHLMKGGAFFFLHSSSARLFQKNCVPTIEMVECNGKQGFRSVTKLQ